MKRAVRKNRSASADSLLLVNGAHPYWGMSDRGGLAPVGPGGDGVLLERHAAALLNRLMEDIRGWGQIVPVSGWRSQEEQQSLWEQSLRENGEGFTRKFVAAPGCSEHQTGLAIDLGLRQEKLDFIRPEFPYTGICQNFRRRAARYGFIQRYPSGKEHITGIAHEPWHFRYVGIPHGEIISTLSVTLEEYLELLKQYPVGGKPFSFRTDRYEFHISYWFGEELDGSLPEASSLISEDNCGGLIVTEWKNREESC